jgi:DNA-directed RNA polymerase subunit N (RpoN/RPB10)
MLPVRCFTCNKVIGRFQDAYDAYTTSRTTISDGNTDIDYTDFFETYHISRICCRKIFITHIDIFQYDPPFHSENIICKSECQFKKIVKSE